MRFSLKFDKNKIEYWANRYPITKDLIQIEREIVPRIKVNKYLSKTDFEFICNWKSPRPKKHRERNTINSIQRQTNIALTTSDEQERMTTLIKLCGVYWPTASSILHFAHSDSYPILDFRALWSLNVSIPPHKYNFDFWKTYTLFCRHLAESSGVSIQTIDRALWQYSKENQKPHSNYFKTCI